MAERFTILNTLPQNLYAEGLPVLIAAGNLLKDNQTGRVLAQIKLQSLSDAVIKAATVAVKPLDTTGKPLGEAVTQEYLDLSVKCGEDFGQKTAVPLPNVSTRGMTVSVTRVVFSDNKEWVAAEQAWEPLPAPTDLESRLKNPELVRQYKATYGGRAQYFPMQHKDIWCCACGAWNRGTVCHACRSGREHLFSFDQDALTKVMEKRLAEEKAARERLAAEEAAQREEARKAAKKRNTIIGILAGVAVAAIGAFFLVTKVILPSIRYNDAIALKDAGQYKEAIAAFTELDGFKDSAEQIEKCETAIKDEKYATATEFFNAKQYYKAIVAFTELDGYKDSKTQIEKCETAIKDEKYATATELYNAKQYYKAIVAFTELDGYKDSAEIVLSFVDGILAGYQDSYEGELRDHDTFYTKDTDIIRFEEGNVFYLQQHTEYLKRNLSHDFSTDHSIQGTYTIESFQSYTIESFQSNVLEIKLIPDRDTYIDQMNYSSGKTEINTYYGGDSYILLKIRLTDNGEIIEILWDDSGTGIHYWYCGWNN